jgi:hypothetical protein
MPASGSTITVNVSNTTGFTVPNPVQVGPYPMVLTAMGSGTMTLMNTVTANAGQTVGSGASVTYPGEPPLGVDQGPVYGANGQFLSVAVLSIV